MLPIKFNDEKKLDILCLGAHCDDIEIGCGGTLLKLFEQYEINSVKWIVFGSNPTRKVEAINCANKFLKNIENKSIIVLDYRDGFMPFNAVEIKESFEKIKNEITPDVIFTHFRNDMHQDHRLVNELTWNTWRNHMILEYEIPKYDGDLGNPNVFVPLLESHACGKSDILMDCFHSQHRRPWFTRSTFDGLMRLRGVECNSRSGYAEAFYARKSVFD